MAANGWPRRSPRARVKLYITIINPFNATVETEKTLAVGIVVRIIFLQFDAVGSIMQLNMGLGYDGRSRHGLLTLEDSEEMIFPYRLALREIFLESFEEMMKQIAGKEHIFGPRARAIILHELICHKAAQRFNTGDLRTGKPRGIFTVYFPIADLRFKKLTKELRPSNVRTRQNGQYTAQVPLPGFRDLTRLTAGYVMNDIQTAISQMHVVLHIGKTLSYNISLSDEEPRAQVLPFPSPSTSPAPDTRRRRISIKKNLQPKKTAEE